MPQARNVAVLRAVYAEALRRVQKRDIPTILITAQSLYRAFDQEHVLLKDGIFPRQSANKALIVRDQNGEDHRWTGRAFSPGIPDAGGLYCSLQQQALVNEIRYYARRPYMPRVNVAGLPHAAGTLMCNCVIRCRMMSSVLAADLSPHNAQAQQWVNSIGDTVHSAVLVARGSTRPLWEQILDSDDCSAARAIGLAIANSGYLNALRVSTARESERSAEEIGDNLIFFGDNGKQIPNLWIEEAYLFPLMNPSLQTYPVEFH